ncbi:MAG: S8/S53 family peptidase [Solirubrobacterales bacterium]|nr:S8/S53 family peptidase [Solirubrobacterales bacterium]
MSAASSATAQPIAAAARIGAAPARQPLDLVLPLKANGAALQQFALAVSTPGSPSYGQFQPISALATRFGAPAAAKQRVVAYLRRAGATGIRIDATGLFADATMSAGLAERVFGTRLAQFRTADAARFVAPASTVAIPPALHGLITGVVGLSSRPLAAPRAQRDADHRSQLATQPPTQAGSSYFPATGTRSGCAAGQATGGFTPNQYLTAYGYDPLHSAGITGQGERVALIEVDGFKTSDVDGFAHCFGLHVPPIDSFPVGVRRRPPPGGESTLDLEVLDAAATGLRRIDVYESSATAASTLKALAAPLQDPNSKPQVISASLGLCEPFTYQAVGKPGIAAAESALAEAAASGISFLASSGDSGSADCTENGTPIDKLAVNYPASSWWVTGVGGTNLVLGATNAIQAEPVWNDGDAVPGSAGGGGGSMIFHRPRYQNGSVSANARAVPDLSMLADVAPGYAVFCSASRDCINSSHSNPWQTVGGTSAATPLLAGGLALVDETLRLHGRQDLGLVNPLLYKLGRNVALAHQVFFDVTQLGNDVGPFIPGNGQPLGCCNAAVGYDEASGWGSVNLAAFSAIALAMQPKIVDIGIALPRRQSPISHRKILTKVSCSGPCLAGAFATITIDRSRSPKFYSQVYHLRFRGQRTIPIKLPAGEVGKLRAALAHHKRIVADVVGAVVDAAGNIEKQSRPQQLTITS